MNKQTLFWIAVLVAGLVYVLHDKEVYHFGLGPAPVPCPDEAETASAETSPPAPAPAPESTAPATAAPVYHGVAADLAAMEAERSTHADRFGDAVRRVHRLETTVEAYETRDRLASEREARHQSRLARIRDIVVEGLNEPALPPLPTFADPAE